MPWCEPCDRFYNPNTLTQDGGCPECGAEVELSEQAKLVADVRAEATKVPWHFWLLLAALVVYLGWRFFEGLEALWTWIF